jgi:glycosyltransferase involved in cell wall biosynthesis
VRNVSHSYQASQPQVTRVAMVLYAVDDRGVSRVCRKVSVHLASNGVDVILIPLTYREPVTWSSPPGVSVDPPITRYRRPTAAIPRLALAIRRHRPDVLFAHLNGPVRATILAKRLARVPSPIVAVEHVDFGTVYRPGWVKNWLISSLYPLADRVAGVTPGIVQDLEERFPKLVGKTAVLPSTGPDLDEVRQLKGEVANHDWYRGAARPRLICSVANIIERKGQDTLIGALPLVRERAGDVRLVLVGRFDDAAYLTRLNEMARTLGVGNHVSFAGYVENPLPFIAGADVFALASRSEGLPMVLHEAMACGVPVVSTDCPGEGPSFALEDGRAGLLVPVGDAPALALAILRVLNESALRNSLVAKGLERVRDFTPQRVAESYLAVARDCVASMAGGGK